MKKIGLALLVVAISGAGCALSPDNNYLYFIKDSRSGLCFAVHSRTGSSNFAFTNVPCDKVEHLIKKSP